MPKAGCGLDRLEWHKFEGLISEICAQSNLTITVYNQSKEEQSPKQNETPVRSALGQAQRQDEALFIVHDKQQAFQRAFELVRRNLNEKQKRWNAIYNEKVHGPTYKEGQKLLLYHPVIAFGTTSKFASLWKGPYVVENCSNDVTFRIKEENSSKQKFVHYDRLKPVFEPPRTSNVPTRNKPTNFQDRADTHKHIDGTLNHDDFLSFLPAPSSIFTPIPAVGRTTTSITTSKNTPITSSAPARREVTRSPPVFSRSPTLEEPSPHTKNDVAIQSPTIF